MCVVKTMVHAVGDVFALHRAGGEKDVSCQSICDQEKEGARLFKCYTFENGNDDAFEPTDIREKEDISCEGTFSLITPHSTGYLHL